MLSPYQKPSTSVSLKIWWAFLWRFFMANIVGMVLISAMLLLINNMTAMAPEINVVVFSLALIFQVSLSIYIIIKSLLQNSLGDYVLLALPVDAYRQILPPASDFISCTLTKLTAPYEMMFQFDKDTIYISRQVGQDSSFLMYDSAGAEVANCHSLPLLQTQSNSYTVSSYSNDSVVVFHKLAKANKFTLQIGDLREEIQYRRKIQRIEMLNAELKFKWNSIYCYRAQAEANLSDHMVAAVLFFIYLERSSAGGG